MADMSKQDQDPTSTAQDLLPSTEEKPPEDVVTENENGRWEHLKYRYC